MIVDIFAVGGPFCSVMEISQLDGGFCRRIRNSFRSCKMGFGGCKMAHKCLEGGSQLGALSCKILL